MVSRKTIEILNSIPGLKIECPNCPSTVAVRRLKLFNVYDAKYPRAAEISLQRRVDNAKITLQSSIDRIEKLKKKARTPQRIQTGAHASNFGKMTERIFPAFTTFPYTRNECRFLADPIDYIVFEGIATRGQIEQIRFVDVKTGKGRLTEEQLQIGSVLVAGKVTHRVIG